MGSALAFALSASISASSVPEMLGSLRTFASA